MMINKRLIATVAESQKYIAGNVASQWVSLCSNVVIMGSIAAFVGKLAYEKPQAGDHDFIMSLPDGYDTVIGEGGASISGGEKQRISIARAIMKNAPIIILDEATANVDPENEKELVEAIDALTKEKNNHYDCAWAKNRSQRRPNRSCGKRQNCSARHTHSAYAGGRNLQELC